MDQSPGALVAPLAVCVEPFDSAKRTSPVGPLELGLPRSRMGSDCESSKSSDVVEDVASVAPKGIRRLGQAKRNDVPVIRADLHRIDIQNTVAIVGQVRFTGGVAVI